LEEAKAFSEIVVRQRLLRDFFSAFENAAPGLRADAIDEYRALRLLAHAWERGALMSGVVEGGLGRVEEVEGKEPSR
jgi:hypothetical protein